MLNLTMLSNLTTDVVELRNIVEFYDFPNCYQKPFKKLTLFSVKPKPFTSNIQTKLNMVKTMMHCSFMITGKSFKF